MAVDRTRADRPQLIRDFMPQLRKRALLSAISLHLILSAGIGLFLHLTNTSTISNVETWIIVGVAFVANCLVSGGLYRVISQPAQDLLAALAHAVDQPSDLPPPNPNAARYQNTALKGVLQSIYEMSTGAAAAASSANPDQATLTSNLTVALNNTTTGLIVYNNKRAITFANKAAPIQMNSDRISSLRLLFNGKDTLDAWLDECDQHAVHAEKIWTRVPDRLPEEEGVRLFDVMASYEKGAVGEVVLTLIDRTAAYSEDEDGLNFIAFAAHELRGPLTVIRGYIDVLEDELGEQLEEDQKELFRRLTVSANRLSDYINNILNTSRYDRRHLQLHLSEGSVAAIYSTINDDMQLRANSQNRLLSVDIPADLPTIAADPASISEVFSNLIDNGIKYSHDGGLITVGARLNGDFVDVSFTDEGIGMPGNVVSNLFQKFYRSHRSRETVAGTGIGLYISKAIIESHGGTISVRSSEGEGSTFTVSLPVYATVADKLADDGNKNSALIQQSNSKGWIKNHSMYRG